MLRERLIGRATRSSRPACARSARSRGTGGRGLPERPRRPRPALAPRRRRDRLDRRVLLLHPARPRPAPPKEPKEGVAGEYWGVHGGGFYHSQKYQVAPPKLPEHLHWFKWEAYTTWLSGFALLVVLYWLDPDARLVDPTVADLTAWQAVGDLGRRARARVAPLRRRLPVSSRRPRCRGHDRARVVIGLRRGRALRRPSRVPPGGRDARDDHGRQRLLHDHPRALGARPREAGGPRARPRAGLRASSARCTTTT